MSQRKRPHATSPQDAPETTIQALISSVKGIENADGLKRDIEQRLTNVQHSIAQVPDQSLTANWMDDLACSTATLVALTKSELTGYRYDGVLPRWDTGCNRRNLIMQFTSPEGESVAVKTSALSNEQQNASLRKARENSQQVVRINRDGTKPVKSGVGYWTELEMAPGETFYSIWSRNGQISGDRPSTTTEALQATRLVAKALAPLHDIQIDPTHQSKAPNYTEQVDRAARWVSDNGYHIGDIAGMRKLAQIATTFPATSFSHGDAGAQNFVYACGRGKTGSKRRRCRNTFTQS